MILSVLYSHKNHDSCLMRTQNHFSVGFWGLVTTKPDCCKLPNRKTTGLQAATINQLASYKTAAGWLAGLEDPRAESTSPGEGNRVGSGGW